MILIPKIFILFVHYLFRLLDPKNFHARLIVSMSTADEEVQDANLAARQVKLLRTNVEKSNNQNGTVDQQSSTLLGQMSSPINGHVGDETPLSDVEKGAVGAKKEKEKYDFEVTWDGGDSDPLNPRSWSRARRWAIVVICSITSGCVYVVAEYHFGSLIS